MARAYASFDHPDVTPLRDLGDGLWLLELFHGPTLAFKDVALQLVGPLFERELARRDERITIIGRHVRRHGLGRHRGHQGP